MRRCNKDQELYMCKVTYLLRVHSRVCLNALLSPSYGKGGRGASILVLSGGGANFRAIIIWIKSQVYINVIILIRYCFYSNNPFTGTLKVDALWLKKKHMQPLIGRRFQWGDIYLAFARVSSVSAFKQSEVRLFHKVFWHGKVFHEKLQLGLPNSERKW